MNEHFIVVFSLDIYPYPKQKAFQFMTYELYRREPTPTPPPPKKKKKKSGTIKKKSLFFVPTWTAKDFNLSNYHVCVFSIEYFLKCPLGTRGFKMRIGPPYPNARRKRRLKWGGFSE